MVKSSDQSNCKCPNCGSILRYRDSRLRVRKREGGRKDLIKVRRLHCNTCHSYHTELPDCLVPYKQYESEVISGVLDGIITSEDLDSEEFPAVETMNRWKHWFFLNQNEFEDHLLQSNYLSSFTGKYLKTPDGSLLTKLRCRCQNWLEILFAIVYNNGHFLCNHVINMHLL